MITGGSDYNSILNSLVTFTVGSGINSRQDIMDITITDDAIAEGDETFTVTLTPVEGPGNPQINPLLSVATITIIDNDCKYTYNILIISKFSTCKAEMAVTVTGQSSFDNLFNRKRWMISDTLLRIYNIMYNIYTTVYRTLT